ncbi:hypothetical protein GCM10010411_63770 [Actinomadura fulvescens]|uniref:Uncharacterized protein n=1 Tax=Actinomadura fulvescens TaxID=46160 RepID=A0ABN3Q7F9_9ACTN
MNLVQIAALADSLNGAGPITQAHEAGLEVWTSAPLGGGELADMVTDDLATMISPACHPSRPRWP